MRARTRLSLLYQRVGESNQHDYESRAKLLHSPVGKGGWLLLLTLSDPPTPDCLPNSIWTINWLALHLCHLLSRDTAKGSSRQKRVRCLRH